MNTRHEKTKFENENIKLKDHIVVFLKELKRRHHKDYPNQKPSHEFDREIAFDLYLLNLLENE